MKPTHITFTGIDGGTSLDALLDIQRSHPYVEFGVLTSYHWSENGNRYLDPHIIGNLAGRGLNLSLHLCGAAAHDAAVGLWDRIEELTCNALHSFNRVQLNISGRSDNPSYVHRPRYNGQEVIVQTGDVDDTVIFRKTLRLWPGCESFSLLIDPSGGRGISSDIKILPSFHKVGYAGGITPDNVREKLSFLMDKIRIGSFWIDMESGVRTDDWFDIDKVRAVLSVCEELFKGQ